MKMVFAHKTVIALKREAMLMVYSDVADDVPWGHQGLLPTLSLTPE
jgi:hypothetical protein